MHAALRMLVTGLAVVALVSLLPRTVAAEESSPSAAAPAAPDAAALFHHVGCAGCHGEHGYYRDKLKGALGKPTESVARWIRNAPSIDPDTPMPSFEKKIDVAEARALAEWVQQKAAALR